MKPTNFTNELLLVFQKKHVNCNYTNLALNIVFKKKIDFLKNSRLNSHKNALKKRNVQKCNETNQFYQWITASFSEKSMLYTIKLTWPKEVFTKKTLIFSKTVD